MFDPFLFLDPDNLERIEGWLVPQDTPTKVGPTITDYTLAVDRVGFVRLVGAVSKHPRLGDTWVTTSPVWQITEDNCYARTSSRWYHLDQMYPIPDGADESDRARLIYGHCLTHDQVRDRLCALNDIIQNLLF